MAEDSSKPFVRNDAGTEACGSQTSKRSSEEVTSDIAEVNDEIRDVRAAIKRAEERIEETGKDETALQRWWGEKESLRRKEERLLKNKELLLEERARLQSTGTLQGAPSQPITGDRSREHIRHLLPGPPPPLPSARTDLDAALRRSHSAKIPVTAECYAAVRSEDLHLAEQHLISTDGSRLPAFLSGWILDDPPKATTEQNITLHVSSSLLRLFSLLEKLSGLELKPKLTFNAAESDTSSQAIARGKRPDTLGIAKACTLLIGEDKKRKMLEGVEDLRRKKLKLSMMHYGDLKFIVGYAAAEGIFKWFWMGEEQQDVVEVGEELNLLDIQDRIKWVQNVVFIYRLLDIMAQTVPELLGRVPVYELLERPSGKESYAETPAVCFTLRSSNLLHSRFRFPRGASPAAPLQQVARGTPKRACAVNAIRSAQQILFAHKRQVVCWRREAGSAKAPGCLLCFTGAKILFLEDGAHKVIPNFDKYCGDFETSFEAVERAYEAAQEAAAEAAALGLQSSIIQAKSSPEIQGRRNTYSVETTPLGYWRTASDLQEARAIAYACCSAARAFHSKGVVHRDFRPPNVVCLGADTGSSDQRGVAKAFMVIDLEAAAKEGAVVSPDCKLANCHMPGVLDSDRRYTTGSDMFEIGILLEGILRDLQLYNGDAKDFVLALKTKTYSAAEALQHSWLRVAEG